MLTTTHRVLVSATLALCACAGSALAGGVGIMPDNGSGSAHLPAIGNSYNTPSGNMAIIDGLPGGTTIDIDALLHSFFYNPFDLGVASFAPDATGHGPGGMFGPGGIKGTSHATLQMPMIGTGTLLGFNRNIPIDVTQEVHTDVRTNFAPVQSFDTNMFRMFGQVTGDPDFDLLRVVAGTDFGLPSPGHTTLTDLGGGQWAVDSFFDITYRIDFVGNPGGSLAGRSGSTTGTVRFSIVPAPSVGVCGLSALGLLAARRRR